MVVVFTGGHTRGGVIFKALTSFIIPAIKSETSLPSNPEGVTALESRIEEIARAKDKKQTPPPLSAMAKKISGETFALDVKPQEDILYPPMWESFSLSFNKPDEATLDLKPSQPLPLHWRGLCHEFPVGLDNTLRITQQGSFNIPLAIKGSWETENTFVLHFDELGNINNWQIS